ncbi:MAG: hypothetical protein NC078_08040 [Ruminococcus sp.]|nr:hypothetical protein [Ruminococcus sp.]
MRKEMSVITKREIVGRIRKYTEEHLFDPATNWPGYYFRERSYSRWAAERIITEVISSNADPFTVIALFVKRAEYFKGRGKAGDDVFAAAYNVGLDILSLFGKEDLL